MDKKPWGITIACLVFAVIALVSFYAAYIVQTTAAGATATVPAIDNQPIQNYLILQIIQMALGSTAWGLAILGIIFAVGAVFLWKQNELVWYFSVGMLSIGILVDVVLMAFFGVAVSTFGVVAIAVSLFVLFMLFHEDVIEAVKPEIMNWTGWNLKG
jgi:hypothetical protein